MKQRLLFFALLISTSILRGQTPADALPALATRLTPAARWRWDRCRVGGIGTAKPAAQAVGTFRMAAPEVMPWINTTLACVTKRDMECRHRTASQRNDGAMLPNKGMLMPNADLARGMEHPDRTWDEAFAKRHRKDRHSPPCLTKSGACFSGNAPQSPANTDSGAERYTVACFPEAPI